MSHRQPYPLHDGLVPAHTGDPTHGVPTGKRNKSKNSCRRKNVWVVAGIIVALMITGAVIGSVLGSRASKAGETGGAEPGHNTTTPISMSVRDKSRLAACGLPDQAGSFSTRLFFQDPDGYLRFVDRKRGDDENWTNPVRLDTLEFKPAADRPISATTSLVNLTSKEVSADALISTAIDS